MATLLGRARVHGIYDSQTQSMDVAEQNFKGYSDQSLVRHADLESACSDPDADALMICTPNHTHFDLQGGDAFRQAHFLRKAYGDNT